MAHWSGEIEAVTPVIIGSGFRLQERRLAKARCGRFPTAHRAAVSASIYGVPPGSFAGWHFECVSCHTVRPLLQRDRHTLQLLGPLLQAGQAEQAYPAEINMEPISYRASAVHYVHG